MIAVFKVTVLGVILGDSFSNVDSISHSGVTAPD